MGKQGQITSFFRPSSASSSSKPVKTSNKPSSTPLNPSKEVQKPTAKRTRSVPQSDKDGPGPAQSKSSEEAQKPTAKRPRVGQQSDKGENDEKLSKRPRHDDDIGNMHDPPSSGRRKRVPRINDDDDVDDDVDNSRAAPIARSVSSTPSTKLTTAEDADNSGEEGDENQPDRETDEKEKGAKARPSSRLTIERTWKDQQPVPYKFLADAFAKVEAITGRLEIQAILSEIFRHVILSTPDDLVPTIYLCINKLAPAHEGIELGIGESILMKAISKVTGLSPAAVKSLYKEKGDLGDVASSARTKQKTMFPPPPLTVRKVYAEFRAIANISGKSTQDAKSARIVKMLVAASKGEAKYISRALLGKLRIHLADKTVIAALSAALTLEKEGVSTDVLLSADGKKKTKMSGKEERIEELLKEANNILNNVYSQLPVWDIIVPKLIEFGIVDDRIVQECKLIPGIPVSPMLAKPTKAVSEVLERFSESSFTCEFKYDGERAQVHRLDDGSMRIYSRNAENLTPKYPDLIRDLPNALSSDFSKASFIIDAEAVAYDVEKKQILPFQELQGRKRKDVEASQVTVKVCLFAFDLLFFNGDSLLSETLTERRKRLRKGFVEQEGQFLFAKGHDSRDPDQILELLNESVKVGCEGLMVKALEGDNSTYEPANRSQNWLKVKKDYLEGCGDSLDLVPIGGYLGRGKRAGIFGAFLLACYNPDEEDYQSICKLGTGFSEADLDQFAKFYNDPEEERTSKTQKSYYRTPGNPKLDPDVWFEPVQVWEVKCADLSISPQHTAAVGHVDDEKGIALRFPRFLRLREDKKPEEATTAEQVAELYLRQSSVANNA